MVLFFDIETGGKTTRSSILSLAYQSEGQSGAFFAQPAHGSRLYKWSEQNIWQPIQHLNPSTEENLISQFINVLEENPSQTLAGWNIGLEPIPSSKGFDIPFLLKRSKQYNLSERLGNALQGRDIIDVGAEYAFRIAESVEKHGSNLVKEGILHPDLLASAQGYMKQAHSLELQGFTRKAIPAELRRRGIQVAGWQLGLVHEAMGLGTFSAHEAVADIAATKRLFDVLPDTLPESFVRRWAKPALENKLVSSALSAEIPDIRRIFEQTSEMESKNPLLYQGFTKSVKQRIAESAGSQADAIWQGRKMIEEFQIVGRGRVVGAAGRHGYAAIEKWGGMVADTISQNKGKLALGLGIGAFWLFSGHDDEYNTIEGLPHGGLAEKYRKHLTDFGSGWIRNALSRGIPAKTIATKLATEVGVGTGISGLEAKEFISKAVSIFEKGGEINFTKFLRSTRRVQGDTERFLVTRSYRSGGFGQTFKLEGMGSGRAAIYKQAKAGGGAGDVIDVPLATRGLGFASPSTMSAISYAQNRGDYEKINQIATHFITETTRQVKLGTQKLPGMRLSPQYEASIQRKAREELGDIVPEILGVTPRGFIQEYGGQSLPKHSESIPALKKMRDVWGELMTSSGRHVRHYDFQIENIVRKGTKLRMIDFGLAAQSAPLTEPSKNLSKEILDTYIKRLEKELGSKLNPVTVKRKENPALEAALQALDKGHTRKVQTKPPNPPTNKIQQSMQLKHKESRLRLKTNSNEPGRRHRRHTTGNIVF